MGSLQVSLVVLSAALLLADDASACGKHRGRRGHAAGGCGGTTATVVVEAPDCAGPAVPPGTASMPTWPGESITGSVRAGNAVAQVQVAPQVQYQIAETGSSCGQESGRRGLFGRRHR